VDPGVCWLDFAGLAWARLVSGRSRDDTVDTPAASPVADKVAGTVVITVASPWNLGLYARVSVALRKSRWQSSVNPMAL
jgi:hypothetical protein